MSDQLKHECGIALIRLLKPLEYYQDKYSTPIWGLKKLNLLLEKQHNRGQDGAGISTVKLDSNNKNYITQYRSNINQPLKDIFSRVYSEFEGVVKVNPDKIRNSEWLKSNVDCIGEILLGHLRYGTFGKNNIENCHPIIHQDNINLKKLVLAGNFNLTNINQLKPNNQNQSDTNTLLEIISESLSKEYDRLLKLYGSESLVSDNLSIENILKESCKNWDGAWVVSGIIGNGDSFVVRDPRNIRPCYFYKNDEVVVVTSERPTLQTTFNLSYTDIQEIKPGHALIIKNTGETKEVSILSDVKKSPCSFERIYFSRGNDKDIYQERKNLGKSLTNQILKSIDYDITNTVFSYIPNTAETSFYGLIDGLSEYLKENQISQLLNTELSKDKIHFILDQKIRIEKVILKDAKLRTFITSDEQRDEMVKHVYDITYGSIRPNLDSIVLLDDSIVRGTTLKQSILTIIDRLSPKKIFIVSSAPQIRYPDCYGIDMSRLGDFIAFQAAIELLKDRGQQSIIEQTYKDCKLENQKPDSQITNVVKKIYEQFTDEEISNKISEIVTDKSIKSEVCVVYQTLQGLYNSIPNHTGDWYFSGNYPTPGGMKVANTSFINYYEKNNDRSY